MNCPDGKASRAGLTRFGAYIGTWQTFNKQDPRATASYSAERLHGRVTIRCSNSYFVIVEQIRFGEAVSADQALAIGLAELPDDVRQVYDHSHPGCRTLQFQSRDLAEQLRAENIDGRVGMELQSEGVTYDARSVTLVLIDILDGLNEDKQGC